VIREPGLRYLGAQGEHARQQAQQCAGCFQHRARGGHHHDHEHEQGFGVVARLRIVDRGRAAFDQCHRQHQHEGPEAEHDLDLAQQVEQPRMARMAVRQHLEQMGGEGVQQGEGEQDQADGLHGRGHVVVPEREAVDVMTSLFHLSLP
jgi:hypothetical protein